MPWMDRVEGLWDMSRLVRESFCQDLLHVVLGECLFAPCKWRIDLLKGLNTLLKHPNLVVEGV